MKGGRRSFCVCVEMEERKAIMWKKQAALPVFLSLREHEEIIDRKVENLKRKFAIHIRKHSWVEWREANWWKIFTVELRSKLFVCVQARKKRNFPEKIIHYNENISRAENFPLFIIIPFSFSFHVFSGT